MYLKETMYESDGWIHSLQDSDLWQALVKTQWVSLGYLSWGKDKHNVC